MGNKPVKYREVDPDIYDAWYHSNFTMDEVSVWYDDFKRKYPSGMISMNEFKQIYREICDAGDPDDYAQYVFRLYDVDRSGYLNFREYVSGISMTSWRNPKTRIEWIFHLYDLDEDGYIGVEEMKAVLRSVFKMTPNPLKNIQVKLPLEPNDINPDTIVERIFTLYDADKDGKLTKQELIKSTEEDPFLSHLLS